MTDDPTTPTSPRWRLDAVALILVAAGAALAVAVGSHSTITGRANLLGPAGEQVGSWMLNSLGAGTALLLTGWFALVLLYIAKRSRLRLVVRASGWFLLTLCSAAAADHLVTTLNRPVSLFGPGGSIGAYLRFTFDDLMPAPLPLLVLIGATVLAVCLIADRLVARLVRLGVTMLNRIVRTAIRGNSFIGRIGDRLLTSIAARYRRYRESRIEVVPLATEAETALAELDELLARKAEPQAQGHAQPEPEAQPIPISRPCVVTQTPPPLRLVPPVEDQEETTGKESGEERRAATAYELPSLSLLTSTDPEPVEDHEQKLRDRAALLEKTFLDFGVNVKVVGIHTGPVITQYEIALETGLRLNKVTTLADDLSLNLGVSSVRIVAPLPGRTTVGVEVPNDHRQTVRLKELVLGTTAKASKFKLPIFLGKDVEGRPLVYDMAAMPHLLIAGRTGTGKSVSLNSIIISFLLTRRPDECRLIMIDPKKVELSEYGRVPHLMHPVVTDDKKAEAILAWAVDKMEERYETLRKARVRNIASYNELGWDEILRRVDPANEEERAALPRTMPYIVIVVDEVGDLLMSMKKEVETSIIRLAQKSRAAGIHLILATQKPTVDVITGLIKSNLPARICFQVASRADSAVVLDEKGAEKLLGMGDMLFLQPGTSSIIRGQGAYVDDKEIERIVEALAEYEPNFESELLNLKTRDQAGAEGGNLGEKLRERDQLYEQAVEVVIREQRGSTSLLQRALGIGYGRASRLIDFMAEDGIVGSFNGSNARDVLISPEEWTARRGA